MAFVELPDIQYTETDAQVLLAEIVAFFQTETGRTLNRADPEMLLLKAFSLIIIQQRTLIDRAAKANLLRYATYPLLDYIGNDLYGVSRLQATASVTTIRFNLSVPLTSDSVIPAGTRVAPVNGDGTLYWSTTKQAIIPAGSTSADVLTMCNVAGDDSNGYLAGNVNVLVDPLPFVQTVVNLTTTAGGADQESDDSYRERIRLSPEGYSTAGPREGYIYWAKTASPAITDVGLSSPQPYQVVVVPLLQGGIIPTQEVLDQVNAVVNDREIRPMTDLVTVQAPTASNYDINLTYYIHEDDAANTAVIQDKVTAAVDSYRLWQRSRLGRALNPSELIRQVMDAGASRVNVVSPVYTELTDLQVAQEGTVTATFGGLSDD